MSSAPTALIPFATLDPASAGLVRMSTLEEVTLTDEGVWEGGTAAIREMLNLIAPPESPRNGRPGWTRRPGR